jgi:tetratricopeptide (TPR) repeat protein
MSIKSIKLESPSRRVALLVAVLIALAGVFFFAKWCFGTTLAMQSVYFEVAEFAIKLSPSDPQTHFALAALREKSLMMEDAPKSVAEYEQATALSPYDFRLWLALGKARERNGDAAGAEKALRRALELAPNYAEVQWIFGNALLRQGKTDEAFAEIRKSVAGDAKYVSPAVATAWQILDGNLAEVRKILGDSPPVNSALAVFLAKQKRFEEALNIWNGLPENEKQTTLKPNGEEILKEMIAAKKYRGALEIQKQIGGASGGVAVGKIANGGFEDGLKDSAQSVFDWHIQEGAEPKIGPNNEQKHGGNLSLVINFNSPTGKEFRTISQTVPVEAGKKYSFETFYKSELKTSATLRWEIVDASDGRLLSITSAIAGNADWTRLTTDFSAPENAEAVTVRLAREACKSGVCPISGSVWFDDFLISEN